MARSTIWFWQPRYLPGKRCASKWKRPTTFPVPKWRWRCCSARLIASCLQGSSKGCRSWWTASSVLATTTTGHSTSRNPWRLKTSNWSSRICSSGFCPPTLLVLQGTCSPNRDGRKLVKRQLTFFKLCFANLWNSVEDSDEEGEEFFSMAKSKLKSGMGSSSYAASSVGGSSLASSMTASSVSVSPFTHKWVFVFYNSRIKFSF